MIKQQMHDVTLSCLSREVSFNPTNYLFLLYVATWAVTAVTGVGYVTGLWTENNIPNKDK